MRAVLPTTLTRLSRHLGLAACGLWVAVCGVACVEEDLALAVMPLDAPAAGLVAAGIDLLPAPLLGGLAR